MNRYFSRVSIVIPVYNEGNSLSIVVEKLYEEIEKVKEICEVILIDDGSSDNTWDTIVKLHQQYSSIKALRLSRNFGKEAAICAGLEKASGDGVIVMDGDLQHPPSLIPQMVHTWNQSKADIIEAVKEHRGKEPLKKRIGARVFYTLLNKFSGFNLEGASDFKLMDRRVLNAWLTLGERNLFFRGMTAWLGFKHIQIPFVVPDRSGGESGWSIFHLIRLAMTAVTAFSSLPLYFITFIGSIFLLFATILSVYALRCVEQILCLQSVFHICSKRAAYHTLHHWPYAFWYHDPPWQRPYESDEYWPCWCHS